MRHFDPAELRAYPDVANPPVSPRMFFEDQTLWGTVVNVRRLIETPASDNQFYLEALGMELLHELARLERGSDPVEHNVRGGLAAWQQRIAATLSAWLHADTAAATVGDEPDSTISVTIRALEGPM